MSKDRGQNLGHGEERQNTHNPTSDVVLTSLILANPTLSQLLNSQIEMFRAEQAQEEQDPGRLLIRFIQARARELHVDESINADFRQQMTDKHGGYSEQSYAMELEAMPASELHIIDATLATGEHWYLVAFTQVENGEYVLGETGTNVIRPLNGAWRVDEYSVHSDVRFNEVLFYLDEFPRCSNVTRTVVNINHQTEFNGGGSPILSRAPMRFADFRRSEPSIVKKAA
ncbi:MAG TPA: hypothetical protein VF820_02715 [Patescibacteria group bacterium]